MHDAQLKVAYYFEAASYNYGIAHNILAQNACDANADAIAEYLNVDLSDPFNTKSKQELETQELGRLQHLKDWYSSKPGMHNYGNETNYLNFYSIATFLRGENKNREALIYYLNALLNALGTAHSQELDRSIFYIAFTYSILGEEKLAMDYSDLSFYFAEKINDRFAYYWEFLQRSNYYLVLNKYDSALAYADKIQNNVNLLGILGQSSYDNLRDKIYRLKMRFMIL